MTHTSEPTTRQDRIRALNDRFRQTFAGGRILITPGVGALPGEVQMDVLNRVRTFDAFTPGNDPYGEHDFGSIEMPEARVFWKIDSYAPDMVHGSDDPADPAKTCRVLTIMLAEEY